MLGGASHHPPEQGLRPLRTDSGDPPPASEPFPWSAVERSRGLRREGREGLPDGARQRARWRSIAGRSRITEATSRQGEGSSPSACSAVGAAAECIPIRSRQPREADRAKGCCAHLPPTLARDPTPQAGGRRPPTTLSARHSTLETSQKPSPCQAECRAATPSATTTSRFRRRVHPSRCSVSPSRGVIDLVIMATMTRGNTRREGRRLAR